MLEQGSIGVGDELVEKPNGYSEMRLVTVAKVTPSGQIILSDGSRYQANGTQKGRYWETSELFVATSELRQEIQRRSNVSTLKSIDWSKVSAGKLEQIVAILESEV
jgi:hypothetical protein